MIIKEKTKNSIIFENDKVLTYKIENSLKYDLYSYYFDFESFPSISLKPITGKYVHLLESKIEFNGIQTKFKEYSNKEIMEKVFTYLNKPLDNINEEDFYYEDYDLESNLVSGNTDNRYCALCIKEIEDYLISSVKENPKKSQSHSKTQTFNHIFMIYKKKNTLNEHQILELEKQITELEPLSFHENIIYSLEDKIAAYTKIHILYDGNIVMTFKGSDFIELPGSFIRSTNNINYDQTTSFKIKDITSNGIEFTNGKKLEHNIFEDEWSDCYNYPAYEKIDSNAKEAIFYENEFVIEPIEGSGIRLGNRGDTLYYIPCYSVSYYPHLNIYYDGKLVSYLSHALALETKQECNEFTIEINGEQKTMKFEKN